MILIIIGRIFRRWNTFRERCLRAYNEHACKECEGEITGRTDLRYPQNIYVGKGAFINGGMIHASKNAKIVIGENCMISYNVHMRTEMHKYEDPNKIMKAQGLEEKDINIGNDVWIGYGAQIMGGVKIADGAVIGAGAIVTHNCDPYTVYAGVPARKIKQRGE